MSLTETLTAISGRARANWRDPIIRNGYLLTLSSLVASAVGLVYWAVAARAYDAATVGRNYAALSTALLLSTFSQLSLGRGLVRYLPRAGRSARRLVLISYGTAATASIATAIGFLLAVEAVSPELSFLTADPLLAIGFAIIVVASALFVLEDNALTGLRRTVWVPIANVVFAVAKLGLLILFALTLPVTGIITSWALSVSLTLLGFSVFVFGRALNRQARESPVDELPTPRELARYVGMDHVSTVFSFGITAVFPVLILNTLGAAQSSYFAMAYVMANALFMFSSQMGSSMVVEVARDPSRAWHHQRKTMSHSVKVIALAVAAVEVVAPLLLHVLGADYAAASTTPLRILALAALPYTVIATMISTARALDRPYVGAVVHGFRFACTIGLAVLVIDRFGLSGAALCMLFTECTVATLMVASRRLWSPRTVS